jgi:hypothetical protein
LIDEDYINQIAKERMNKTLSEISENEHLNKSNNGRNTSE